MNEKTLENKIKRHLKENGHYFFKTHGGAFGKSGIPDLIICIKGLFVGLEIKNPNKKGKVSELQKYNIEKIKDSFGHALVIDSWEQYLDEYYKIVSKKYDRR
ncbi:VRR-NUC domain-containing protein [Streptobacillus ratti]|uniref:VRR-NUC domain-containing protein n=1 Tax=Streptobacillus ratti TaxID=1720557 RepID=UPI000933EC98|nr:VRR-NUC domain-containing protein [Streptobacillus ratti]